MPDNCQAAYTFMKIASFLAIVVCLGVLDSYPASAQDADKIITSLNWVNVPVDQVLDFYKKSTKSELHIGRDVSQTTHGITLQFRGSPEALTPLIEQALLKQAGIVITHLDDKRASVTYNNQLELQPSGQSQSQFIILTSQDVKTNTVHLITTSDTPVQNVMFKYAGKTSAEIKTIIDSHPRAKIMWDDVVMAETVEGGCGGYVDKHTNYVGLVLIFSKYDQAKLAEKTLRGD
jgi:hypothetical protein